MTEKVLVPEDEIETIINYSRQQLGSWAEVYTTDKTVMKRYNKFALQHPEYCRVIAEDRYSMTFSADPRVASIFPKAPRKVNLSEERKLEITQRLLAARNSATA